MNNDKYKEILNDIVSDHWAEKALDSLSDIVVILDNEFKIVQVNNYAEKILGYSHSELYGKNWIDMFIPKEELDSFSSLMDTLLNTNKTSANHHENPIKTKSGDLIYILWSNVRIKRRGRTVALLAIGRDQTQKKVLERNLIESEERYKDVVNRANDGIVIIQDGKFTFANLKALKMLMCEESQVINAKFSSFVAPDFRKMVSDHYEKRMTGENVPSIYETAILQGNKNILDVELNAGIIQINGKPADLVIIRDITERKKMESALRESERQYRLLFENMSAGFAYHKLICDDDDNPCDYRFLEVNKYFEELTGLKAKNIVGKTIKEILPEIVDDKFDWIGTYGNVAKTGKSMTLDDQFSDTLKQWYSVIVYSPRENYFATVFLNISDRKKMEEKLRITLSKLESSNKELKKLNDFMIGRELRMRDLKEQIENLKNQLSSNRI